MSSTKLVTSIAALQCVERGLLGLDADADALLPELGRTRVLKGFAEHGSPVLEPRQEPITLRRLLTHTSGFGFEFLSPGVAAANRALGFASYGSRAGVLVCGCRVGWAGPRGRWSTSRSPWCICK